MPSFGLLASRKIIPRNGSFWFRNVRIRAVLLLWEVVAGMSEMGTVATLNDRIRVCARRRRRE